MDASRSELVAAYWLHHAMSQGTRAERLEATGHVWAIEAVSDMVDDDDPLSVIVMLDQLLAALDSDPCYLGAGPIEELLTLRGQDVLTLVVERCRGSVLWRSAVGCVWLDASERVGLEALADYLPVRR